MTHDNDGQGGHGSHVAGISAANRYVPEGEGLCARHGIHLYDWRRARRPAHHHEGLRHKAGGAYDSDYMAAIEDAILLDCDVVNLSLGSGNPGFTTSDLYQGIMDKLTETDTVVSISAGNSYSWAENSYNGALYAEDVNFHTGGSPGAYTNAFTVASVDNAGMIGSSFQAAGRDVVVYTETLYYNATLSSMDTSAGLRHGMGVHLPG